MSTLESINAAISCITPYRDRARKLHPVAAFDNTEADLWYSYLINDWIVNEPDSEALMKLFIELGFQTTMFVGFVVHGTSFWDHKTLEKLVALLAEVEK